MITERMVIQAPPHSLPNCCVYGEGERVSQCRWKELKRSFPGIMRPLSSAFFCLSFSLLNIALCILSRVFSLFSRRNGIECVYLDSNHKWDLCKFLIIRALIWPLYFALSIIINA